MKKTVVALCVSVSISISCLFFPCELYILTNTVYSSIRYVYLFSPSHLHILYACPARGSSSEDGFQGTW